jgi:ATP-binding cassette subfamily B protein
MSLVASIAVAVVYGLGGALAIQGELTVGVVVALVTLLNRLYGPITALSNVQVDVMTTLVSFERVLEVLDLEPLVQDAPQAVDLDWAAGGSTSAPAIGFREVWFRYPAGREVSLASLEGGGAIAEEEPAWTLADVSFEVPRGAMVALVGPSGAGKSTASLLVSRLYDATRGAVELCGQDIRGLTARSVRRVVGVVAQDAHLFHATLRDNLLFSKPDADRSALWEALERAQAGFVADLPQGLDTLVGDRGYRLSGGERQRIAIARLLLKAPEIVVLDEATAHLDAESELAVQRALAEALKGRTSLVIAHRLSTIRDADLIVVLDHGRVVQRGPHRQLLAEGGLYASLYQLQFAESRA